MSHPACDRINRVWNDSTIHSENARLDCLNVFKDLDFDAAFCRNVSGGRQGIIPSDERSTCGGVSSRVRGKRVREESVACADAEGDRAEIDQHQRQKQERSGELLSFCLSFCFSLQEASVRSGMKRFLSEAEALYAPSQRLIPLISRDFSDENK